FQFLSYSSDPNVTRQWQARSQRPVTTIDYQPVLSTFHPHLSLFPAIIITPSPPRRPWGRRRARAAGATSNRVRSKQTRARRLRTPCRQSFASSVGFASDQFAEIPDDAPTNGPRRQIDKFAASRPGAISKEVPTSVRC